MATWYLGKISFQKETENGSLQSFREAYLVDSVSYTEAEAILFQRLQETRKDFQLLGITKMKLSEVFIEDNEGYENTFFKMKCLYITFDEKTQKEKNVPHMMLINAGNPLEAYNHLVKHLGTLNDYKITDINPTPILEVFKYDPELKIS